MSYDELPAPATKLVPIGEDQLAPVLWRMRRDAENQLVRWGLGRRGRFELDARFTPTDVPGAQRSEGRLWSPDGDAVSRVEILIRPYGPRTEIVVAALPPLPPRWQTDPGELRALARAAAIELAEELRWHASRLAPIAD